MKDNRGNLGLLFYISDNSNFILSILAKEEEFWSRRRFIVDGAACHMIAEKSANHMTASLQSPEARSSSSFDHLSVQKTWTLPDLPGASAMENLSLHDLATPSASAGPNNVPPPGPTQLPPQVRTLGPLTPWGMER